VVRNAAVLSDVESRERKAMEGVQVTVTVPSERIGEFYELFGLWLQSSEGELIHRVRTEMPSVGEATTQTGIASRDWKTGDWDERVSDARIFYKGLSWKAKQVCDYLTERPGTEVSANELGELLDSTPNGVAGTLSSFGFQGRNVRRVHPFRWTPGPHGESTYSFDPEVAELFNAARI
jgi:hypothetical protein